MSEKDMNDEREAPNEVSKLVDIRSFRQRLGIPERHQVAAELIQSAGNEIVTILGKTFIAAGRSDLIPRTMAYALNSICDHLGSVESGIRSRLLDNTSDYLVAQRLGNRSLQYRKLFSYLVKKGCVLEAPLIQELQLFRDLEVRAPVSIAVLCSGTRFKAFAIQTPAQTYLVCLDKAAELKLDDVADLHIREVPSPSDDCPAPLATLKSLSSRSKLVKAGYLRHMDSDGELSAAPNDTGYVCSVWLDDDVDGGWVTSRAYQHYDSLALVTYVLDELCKAVQQSRPAGSRQSVANSSLDPER